MADQSDRSEVRDSFGRIVTVVALTMLGIALWSWAGGLWDIWERSEAALVQSARGALPGEGWPLPRWILYIVLKLDGDVSNGPVRLPSVIFAIITLLTTFRLGAYAFGRPAGWFAALAFAATAGLFGAVPAVYPGMMLAALIALAVATWIARPRGRAWVRIAATALYTIAAFLTAGWLALVMIAAILGGTAVVRRRWSAPAAWLIVGVIALIDKANRDLIETALLPPAAIYAGFALSWLSARRIPRLAGRVVAVGVLGAAALIFIGTLIMYLEPDDVWRRGLFVLRPGMLLLLCSAFVTAAAGYVIWKRPKTSTCIAALLLILFMGNAVVFGALKPAMNPVRSGEIVSTALGNEVTRQNRTIGVLGRTHDPRFHVYGRYEVKMLAEQPSELADPSGPKTLLVATEDLGRLGSALHAAGYHRTKRIEALGMGLLVMQRAPDEADPPKSVVRLFALGDTGTGEEEQYAIGRRMGEVAEQFGPMTGCLLLGDVLYENDKLEVALEKRFLKPFEPLISRGVPFYAALGNHDYSKKKKVKFELKSPWFNMDGRHYYSKTFGEGLLTVFILDCEKLRSDPEQYLWLKSELSSCNSTWKVLVNHVPMIASEVLHKDNPAMFDMIDHLMVEGKIDLVLSGHNHFYERRVPYEGIQYVTVGCGGHVDDNFEFPEDNKRVVGYNQECCFSWMEVSRDAIHFRVRNESGEAIDEFRLRHDSEQKLKVEEISRGEWSATATTAAAR